MKFLGSMALLAVIVGIPFGAGMFAANASTGGGVALFAACFGFRTDPDRLWRNRQRIDLKAFYGGHPAGPIPGDHVHGLRGGLFTGLEKL